jgi:hypothetical protein
MTDDPTLFQQDEYFARIERQFGLRRGGQLVLSPRDWQRIERWQEQGIPLTVVLQGINRAFDQFDAAGGRGRRINSLSYCEQQINDVWDETRELAAAAGDNDTEAPAIVHLRECVAICRRYAAQAGPALGAAADDLERLADTATTLTPGELDRQATEIETRLRASADEVTQLPLPRFSPWAI